MTHRIVLIAVLLLSARTALALIEVGGKGPVDDRNWPAGSVELANLPSRIAWWEGPPFGGGERQFLYRGDATAFQAALDLFAKIRAPQLRLIIHEGPKANQFISDKKDQHYDWSFTVWDPRSFHQLFNNPQSFFMARDPDARFRRPVDPPRTDVYVAGDDGKGIDCKKVKVPANVRVSDERATSNGYAAADGSVLRGDVYDVVTSKPIAGATVTLRKFDGRKDWENVGEAKSDAAGHFELKKVPGGTFAVVVSADGHVPRSVGFVEFGKNALKEYEAVYLAPPASIGGTVTDADGKPLAGVKIRADDVLGPDGRGYLIADKDETASDAAGKFEITGVPQGFLRLSASHESYFPIDTMRQYKSPAKDVALRMTATGAVEGRVLKKDGSPAADAQVSVDPEGDPIGKWGGGINVKPDGTFKFENVPPGKYTVSANPGMAKLGKDARAKQIEVKAGETAKVELSK